MMVDNDWAPQIIATSKNETKSMIVWDNLVYPTPNHKPKEA